MHTLHSHSIISQPYSVPIPARRTEQSYGLLFGESKAGANIHFDEKVRFHLLFLLKGAAHVKAGGKETLIVQGEFLRVDSTLPVECICTYTVHYVMIGMDTKIGAEHPQAIPTDLSVFLRYLMGTMPVNEKIKHYLIPRIVRSMMRTYPIPFPLGKQKITG